MAHIAAQPLFILGLILVAGYFAGRGANFLRLPRISGYIVTGMFFSPSVTGFVSRQQIDDLFTFTSEIALAFIAYSIGGSLLLSRVKGLGGKILWINTAQGFGAFACTCLVLYAAGGFLPSLIRGSHDTFVSVVLILGGLSVATAPAATMAVVHELRARGPLTTTLLAVVALDDALSIIVFTVCITIAGQLLLGSFDYSMIVQFFAAIGGGIALGLLGGYVFCFLLDPAKRPEANFMVTLGAVLLVTGASGMLGLSPLLSNMTMGFIIINRIRQADDLFHQLDIVEEAIFCLFFALAAAHYDTAVFVSSSLLGGILLLARFAGKLGGTYLGGRLSGASPVIYRHLGFTLLPQAGLSLGLIFFARPILPPEIFDILLSALMVSIILNEIISPPLVKWAITRAGESTPGR